MKEKVVVHIVILTTLIAFGAFTSVLVHAVRYNTETEIPLTASVANSVSKSKDEKLSEATSPLRLIVPTLGINAKVQKVGITKKGNMGTPNNFTDVGWYKYGTLPGALGSAVIAGHVDNGLALPGVFKHLENLVEGDSIYVEMNDGTKVKFIVTDLSTYDYDAAVRTVFEQNDARYLKLITCAGVWVKSYGTHDKRLVVTAVAV